MTFTQHNEASVHGDALQPSGKLIFSIFNPDLARDGSTVYHCRVGDCQYAVSDCLGLWCYGVFVLVFGSYDDLLAVVMPYYLQVWTSSGIAREMDHWLGVVSEDDVISEELDGRFNCVCVW